MESLTLEYESIDDFLSDDSVAQSIRQTIVTGMAEADYRHSCEGKTKYGHMDTAIQVATTVGRKIGQEMEAYKCRHCEDGFHIGHKKVDIEVEL